MKQFGAIVYGGGLDHQVAIEVAKTQGYTINHRDGFAELWR